MVIVGIAVAYHNYASNRSIASNASKPFELLEPFDKCHGFSQLRESCFICLELPGVDAAADTPHTDRVFEVEHLVVEQVLDGVTGAGGAIKDAADDDGVVGGVVVAE